MTTQSPQQITEILSNENPKMRQDKKLKLEPFLRIFIGNFTTVVAINKPITLKEAVHKKLASRKLEIDSCTPYVKDTLEKLDWNLSTDNIPDNSILIRDLNNNDIYFSDDLSDSMSIRAETLVVEEDVWWKSADEERKFQSESQFIRVFIGDSTSMICKEEKTLYEALIDKLMSRNLEVNNCVAYLKNSDLKLDWNTDLSCIEEDSIFIQDLNSQKKHFFIKKSILKDFSLSKCCSFCKRRLYLSKYSYMCKKCTYTVCYNNECKQQGEQLICSTPRKFSRRLSLFSSSSKPKLAPNVHSFSEQILPINQIYYSRVRSMSETEISTLAKHAQQKTENDNRVKDKENKSNKRKLPRWDSIVSFEIPSDQIEIDKTKKIGAGTFGLVFKGVEFYHGDVAIKQLNIQQPTQEQIDDFNNEVGILKATRHQNILLFIGCILEPFMAIVTEWCPGSSLYKHLHVEEEPWEMNQLVSIAKQTATGMEYLHARGILHRDLKSNNIFLVPNEDSFDMDDDAFSLTKRSPKLNNKCVYDRFFTKWNVKIGDFGLASVKSICNLNTFKKYQPTGSILWMAPEVITQKVEDPYSIKSDVYSFAVVLYELLSGRLPFTKKEQNMVLFLVGSGRLKLNPDDSRPDAPNKLKKLIVKCSLFNREHRPDFIEVNQILKKVDSFCPRSLTRSRSHPSLSFSSASA